MTPRSNEAADILRLQASLIGAGDRPSDRTLAEALEHGAKEIDRLAATSAVRQEPAGARAGDGKTALRLTDTQWVNIVNHANCYLDMDKDDAVRLAVKLTEARMAMNAKSQETQP